MSILAGPKATTVDPITFELIRNALTAACNEMSLVVAKTAYSTPINEGRDFSSTIYDRHGQQITQGQNDIPAFTGITLVALPEVIRQIGVENMVDGDVYLLNDPYVSSTHCNDVHAVKPVFVDGEHYGFVATTAHWSDVGGSVPGSLFPGARSVYEEGVRIPAVAIYRAGVLQRDLLKLMLLNMRESWERQGDLNAQVAALHLGEERLKGICAKYGADVVSETMDAILSYSERLIRGAFERLPDGAYSSQELIDQDMSTGEPKVIRLTLVVRGDEATLDFTASDGPAGAAQNCTLPGLTAAVFIGLAAMLPPIPMNAGVLRPVTLDVTEGSLMWAKPPSAISGMTATALECTVGCVINCLSQANPERGAGTPFSVLNVVFAGHDARRDFDAPFINYSWGFGGLGGTFRNDGADVMGSSYTASTRNIPAELQERRYPVRYARYMFIADSGGPGRTRGGLGLDQLIEFPYMSGTVSCMGNRERFGPPGVFGGEPGRRARLVANADGPRERHIGVFAANAPVEKGESMSFWSAGGGGYGDPLERPPAAVLEDVIDGYVTVGAAAEDYGVVVRELDARRLEYVVDEAATAALRARRASSANS